MNPGRLRRIALVVGVLGALMAVAAGCGGSGDDGSSAGSVGSTGGDSGGEKVRVAQFVSTLANTYNQADKAGADAAAEDFGNVDVQTFASEFDPNEQIQQIQTAAASGQYDAFVIAPLDGVRVIPAVEAAAAKGITVVCEFSVCGPKQDEFANELDGVTVQTGIDAGQMAQQTAPVVNEACEGKNPCNIAIMFGLAQLVSENWWADELKANLDPSIEVVAEGEGQYLAETSYKAFKDILQAHDDIDVVVAPGDQMIVGSEQAIDEAGKKGEVALIGTGASDSSTAAIEAGDWYGSAILRPFHDGYVATEMAVKAARGESVPDLIDTRSSPLIPGGVVTQENVSKWKPEWAG